MYGSQFVGDVATDAFNKNIKTTVLNPSTNTVPKTDNIVFGTSEFRTPKPKGSYA
jgi:hypothetical protein